MTLLFRLLYSIDASLIITGYKLVVFLCEWFSITRRTIERGLIVLIDLLFLAGAAFEFAQHILLWYYAAFAHLTMVCVFTWSLLRSHRKTDRQRAILLFYEPAMLTRPLVSFLYVFLASIQFLPKITPRDICVGSAYILFPIAEYIMATGGQGTPGRRRKAALHTLRQAFRMPVPSTARTTLG